MEYYDKKIEETAKFFGTDVRDGLSAAALDKNVDKFGYNRLTERKKRGFFSKLFSALKEPMLLILLFGL